VPRSISALTVLAALCLAGTPGYSQSRGASTGSNSSASGTSATLPPSDLGPANVRVNDASWFLNGHVLMEDGSVPTDRVDIVSICSGLKHTEGHIDKKGEFSFRLGRSNPGVTPDAEQTMTHSANPSGTFNVDPSVSGSMSANPLGDCVIQAELTGYRSDVVLLASRTIADNPNIGTIVLHPTGTAPTSTVSAAALAAPKAAQKAYAKGLEAENNRKNQEAAKYLAEAVHLFPQYAEAWYEYGNVQAALHEDDNAKQSYDTAVAADPNFVPPYLKLALIYEKAKNWQALADATSKVIKLQPSIEPQVYLYNSIAEINLKDAAAAEQSAKAGVKLDTDHRIPKFWYILGVLMSNRGELGGAIEQFKNYLQFAPDGPDAAAVRGDLAQVEKMAAVAPKQ